MLAGVTACPDCGEELALSALSESRPLADVTQTCPVCERTLDGAVLFYPNGDFTMVCPYESPDESVAERKKPPTTCRCGSDVTVLTARSRTGAIGAYCPECCPSHYDVG
jgi:hypothetical protein